MSLAGGKRPWLVVVGGFLGAGKTTLLLAAIKELATRSLRCALVVNDQGDELVDTKYSALNDVIRTEVTGGCFCCKFSQFVAAMDDLLQYAPDVIFAEPVGSCTDISATMLQPLKAQGERYRLAPFTVLVDPSRVQELMRPAANPQLAYLFTKQLEEADLICFTKSDLQPAIPQWPELLNMHECRQLSASTGQGVSAWLEEVLSGELTAGNRLLDIDYVRYAMAEAALAWLNLSAELRSPAPITPAGLLGPFLEEIDNQLTAFGIAIVHLKAIASSSSGFVKAAICASGQEPRVEGDLAASPEAEHHLLVNLRCVGDAGKVESIVRETLRNLNTQVDNLRLQCFHPAAPNPEHRASAVLGADRL